LTILYDIVKYEIDSKCKHKYFKKCTSKIFKNDTSGQKYTGILPQGKYSYRYTEKVYPAPKGGTFLAISINH